MRNNIQGRRIERILRELQNEPEFKDNILIKEWATSDNIRITIIDFTGVVYFNIFDHYTIGYQTIYDIDSELTDVRVKQYDLAKSIYNLSDSEIKNELRNVLRKLKKEIDKISVDIIKVKNTLKKGEKLKQCSRCNKWKIRNKFHKNNSTKDGFQGICKECRKLLFIKFDGMYYLEIILDAGIVEERLTIMLNCK